MIVPAVAPQRRGIVCPKGYRQSGSAACAAAVSDRWGMKSTRCGIETEPLHACMCGFHILHNLEQAIRRTPHAQRPTIEDMGIDHRRADVRWPSSSCNVRMLCPSRREPSA